jgi:hypothetical protein
MNYQTIDDLRRAAENRGDTHEAARLTRLLERLDEYKTAYGKQHGMDKAFADADAIVAELYAAPGSEAKAQGEYGDAYQVAREDLAIWRRRALEAEEKVRHQEQIIDRMGEDLNAINGPTFMGESVIRDTVEVSRKAIQRLFKAAGCSGSVGNSEVLNAASDRLKAAPVQQVSVPDGFCIGAWRDALEKIAKYAPQVNCAARTELERAGLIAVHALIAFSAPQFRHARGTQTASNAAPAAPAADAWIPVSERLPGDQGHDSEEVLCFLNGHCSLLDNERRQGGGWGNRLGYYDADIGTFRVFGRPESHVTHWMPLPAAPIKIEANRHDQ